MRCWNCKKLVVIPESVFGQPLEAGQLRRDNNDTSALVTADTASETWMVTCPHCGSAYTISTTMIRGARKTGGGGESEVEEERGRGWR